VAYSGGDTTDRGSGFANNANAGNIKAALNNMQAGNYNTSDTEEWNQVTGGMSVAQFQQLPQAQQQKLTTQIQSMTDARAYAPSLFDQIMGGVAMAGTVGALTAGAGAELGFGAGLGSNLLGAGGTLLNGTAGSIALGAGAGAAGGAAKSVLSTGGKNIGSSVLTGAAGGALGAAAAPITSSLTGSGIPAPIAGLATKVGTGLATSAIGNAVNGSPSQPSQSSSTQMGAMPNLVANNGSTPTASSGVQPTSSSALPYIGAGALGAGALGSFGAQGNSSNMAGTDTSLASTITGALPGVLQAGIGTAGSLAASNAQTNADQNAITTQQNAMGNINSIWGTQASLGQGADTALGSALGTNGQPANYSGFENMPGYQFAVSQGTQAFQRQAAAMGNAYTPNTAAAIGQYVTGTASQDYNTYISQLMGAAGLGTTANQGLQTGTQQTSNNISQLQQNIGQAQAAGYSGVASSASGLFSPNGAGTGLINSLGGGSGVNRYGVPQGNGTTASNASDPFANTSLANNQNAIDAYNQNNGPTAGDISGDTSGAVNSNYLNGIDPGSPDMSGIGNLGSFGDDTSSIWDDL
jgi:hypothetical protein